MDFEYSPVQHAFYREFRDWLAANLPADLCLDDPADDRVASDRETFERRRAWQKTMHAAGWEDRKSTRLNSSHVRISYAVFCLKKKKTDAARVDVAHSAGQ